MSDAVQDGDSLDMDVLSAFVTQATTDVMIAESRRAEALKSAIEYWHGNIMLLGESAPPETVTQTAATFERYLSGSAPDNVESIRPVEAE